MAQSPARRRSPGDRASAVRESPTPPVRQEPARSAARSSGDAVAAGRGRQRDRRPARAESVLAAAQHSPAERSPGQREDLPDAQANASARRPAQDSQRAAGRRCAAASNSFARGVPPGERNEIIDELFPESPASSQVGSAGRRSDDAQGVGRPCAGQQPGNGASLGRRDVRHGGRHPGRSSSQSDDRLRGRYRRLARHAQLSGCLWHAVDQDGGQVGPGPGRGERGPDECPVDAPPHAIRFVVARQGGVFRRARGTTKCGHLQCLGMVHQRGLSHPGRQAQGRESTAYEPAQLRTLSVQARAALVQAQNQYLAAWKQLAAVIGLPDMPTAELEGRADMPVPHDQLRGDAGARAQQSSRRAGGPKSRGASSAATSIAAHDPSSRRAALRHVPAGFHDAQLCHGLRTTSNSACRCRSSIAIAATS